MASIERTDRLLLAVLLPLVAVVLFLHVQAILTTGIAQAPFFAAPPATSDGYPTVGGPRLEHGVDESGLRVGDRLLRVGNNDLRGHGYLGFDALVVEAAGPEARTSLVYERDGQSYTTTLELLPYPQPWMRVPFLTAAVIAGWIVLLRARGFPQRRAFFVATTALAIAELHFYGGSRWQTYASLIAFNFGGSVAMVATLRFLIGFPPEVDERKRLPAWLCSIGLLFTLGRMNYMLGGPVPTPFVPRFVLALDLVFVVSTIAILTWNTWNATPIGRRRSEWVLFGGYASMIPMSLTLVPGIIGLEGFDYFEALPFGFVSGVFLPLAILVAIVRYDLFDIDRVITSFGAYTFVAGALLLLSFVAAPAISETVARLAGVEEQTTRWLLVAALLGVVVASGPAMRSRVERVFFPDRRRREQGFQQLYVDLSDCRSVTETVELLVDRLRILLDPDFVEAHVRSGDQFLAAGGNSAIRFPIAARSAFVLGMEADPRPLGSADGSLARRIARLPTAERTAVEKLDASLVVPLRCGKDLSAVILLGAQRSGESWTLTDMTLLRGAAERASGELLRISGVSSLERERERAIELEALKEAADEANLAKSRFLAAASHDLRQPLHALGLFVSRLENEVKGSQAAELVDQIQNSTESLSDMFTTLLDLSRLDAGAVEPAIEDFALEPILVALAAELRAEASEKGLEFEMHCEPVHVRSDPQLLARILRNLLVNAVRHTGSGSVRLIAERGTNSSNQVEVSVVDTGPGIPEELQREVFREFVQLEGAKAASEGIGLGLSIVDRLARILGHTVALESNPGEGSIFRVSLRTVAAPQLHETATAPAPPGSELRDRLVLVIDDDLAILDGMRRTLQGWGCRVLIAATIEDALEGIEQRGKPDVVLSDYRLAAGVTGLEAIAAIRRATGERIAAAVITGEASEDSIREIQRAGLPHLTKPVAHYTLRSALAELLRMESR